MTPEIYSTTSNRVSSFDRIPNLPFVPSIYIRVQNILDFLIREENGVRVVGIYGPGGLGKTTLLNMTIGELMKEEAFSELAYVEVREKLDDESVKTLQSSILEQLGGPATKLLSIQHGKGALREHFLKLKDIKKAVCLAIDNLWEEADLEKLLPDQLASILPSTCSLIITTRSLNVVEKLDQLCSSPSGDQFHKLSYRPEELSLGDSKNLFTKHASKIVPLTNEHLPLVDAIVPLCGGLPLAVQVLGSLFSTELSRESYHWKDVERRLRSGEENLPTGSYDMSKALQLSYDRLKLSTQKAFLDAVHFFNGWEWHTVRHILGNDEMVELENYCLLTRSVKGVERGVMRKGHPCKEGGLEEEATVRIHDLIFRLGKHLAQQNHLKYVVEKSFWDSIVRDKPEELEKVRGVLLRDSPEVIDVNKEELGKETAVLPRDSPEMIDAKKVERMQNLRFLHLEGFGTEDDMLDLRQLKQLRYLRLCCPRFSKQRATSELFCERRGGDSLRFLSLGRIDSSLRGAQFSSQLRELHLHDCPNLVELPPSSSELTMLERLHIHDCASFSKLPEVCSNWKQLLELVIIGANRMTDLPACIGIMGSLKLLSLAHCGNLVELPPSSSQLKMLERLSIQCCARFSGLPHDCGNWERLEELTISGTNQMAELPACIGILGSLKLLSLADCGNLVELPSSSSQLKMLERLRIEGCARFRGLPQDCGNWERLQELTIRGTNKMAELPASMGNLGSLKLLSLAHCGNVVELPSSSSQLKMLERLHIEGCARLRRLPQGCCNWKRLHELDIGGANEMTELDDLCELLKTNGCLSHVRLTALDASFDIVKLLRCLQENSSLRMLDLSGCDCVDGDDVLATILDLVRQNCSIAELELAATPLARQGKDVIVQAQLGKQHLFKEVKEIMSEGILRLCSYSPREQMLLDQAKSARVFLCGYPYAGKTALCRSMVQYQTARGSAYKRMMLRFTEILSNLGCINRYVFGNEWAQRTQRTRGIEIFLLTKHDERVTIWDMAGQEEYHAFHDLMIPNMSGQGSTCLFLILFSPFNTCVVGSTMKSKEKFEEEIFYWLRFIASNTIKSRTMQPHVSVVLTNADRESGLVEWAKSPVLKLRSQFRDVFQGMSSDSKVFAVNALSSKDVGKVVDYVMENCRTLLKKQPPLFKASAELGLLLENWNLDHPDRPTMKWTEFSLEICNKVPKLGIAGQDESERRRKAVAAYLHDVGEIIYFQDLDLVVVNPKWFCHEVMGRLIQLRHPHNERNVRSAFNDDRGVASRASLERVLKESFQSNNYSTTCIGGSTMECQRIKPEELVSIMARMGLCYPEGQDVFIPATFK